MSSNNATFDTTPIDIATGNFNVASITISMVVALWITAIGTIINMVGTHLIKWKRLKVEERTAAATAAAPPPPAPTMDVHLTVTPPHSRHHSRRNSHSGEMV